MEQYLLMVKQEVVRRTLFMALRMAMQQASREEFYRVLWNMSSRECELQSQKAKERFHILVAQAF